MVCGIDVLLSFKVTSLALLLLLRRRTVILHSEALQTHQDDLFIINKTGCKSGYGVTASTFVVNIVCSVATARAAAGS